MNRENRADRFFIEVGEAMFMNDTRAFINMETLEIEIYVAEDFFIDNEMEDTATEEIENIGKFLPVEHEDSSTAYKVMEAFTETVKDRQVKYRLASALQKRRPFANFKVVIDNSIIREQWFQFRDEAYAEIAKQWLEVNAPTALKEKIMSLVESGH